MAKIGYVRCSTDKQTVMQQIDALRAEGCKPIFQDRAVRATAKNRPALQRVRKALKPGDTFVVTAIDRGFRNTREAIAFLDDVLTENGVTFKSLRERIDTSTPEGRRWYMIEAAEAEYERSKISIRTREAMQAHIRRGRKFGRKRKLSPERVAKARALLEDGTGRTIAKVARRFRVSPRTLKRNLAVR